MHGTKPEYTYNKYSRWRHVKVPHCTTNASCTRFGIIDCRLNASLCREKEFDKAMIVAIGPVVMCTLNNVITCLACVHVHVRVRCTSGRKHPINVTILIFLGQMNCS